MLKIIEFIQTDLPDPVAPAINKCGISDIEETIVLPVISLPNTRGSSSLEFINSSVSKISRKKSVSLTSFGVSIPTLFLPGIGATILISLLSNAIARSSWRFTILLILTPVAGLSS